MDESIPSISDILTDFFTPFFLGIRWYPSGGTGIGQPPRWVYPMTAEINRRIEAVAEDQRLRTGKEERPRRSEFIEW